MNLPPKPHRSPPPSCAGERVAMQRCAVFSTFGQQKNNIYTDFKGEIAAGKGRNGNSFRERSRISSE